MGLRYKILYDDGLNGAFNEVRVVWGFLLGRFYERRLIARASGMEMTCSVN